MTLSADGGPVVIRAYVDDPNSGDTHTFRWAANDAGLTDSDATADTFTFDPATVAAGVYRLQVHVTDSGTPAATATASVRLRVVPPSPRGRTVAVQSLSGSSAPAAGGAGAVRSPPAMLRSSTGALLPPPMQAASAATPASTIIRRLLDMNSSVIVVLVRRCG